MPPAVFMHIFAMHQSPPAAGKMLREQIHRTKFIARPQRQAGMLQKLRRCRPQRPAPHPCDRTSASKPRAGAPLSPQINSQMQRPPNVGLHNAMAFWNMHAHRLAPGNRQITFPFPLQQIVARRRAQQESQRLSRPQLLHRPRTNHLQAVARPLRMKIGGAVVALSERDFVRKNDSGRHLIGLLPPQRFNNAAQVANLPPACEWREALESPCRRAPSANIPRKKAACFRRRKFCKPRFPN